MHPGDLIFGEVDGVVVIPQAVAAQVVTRALEVAATEHAMRIALERGSTLRGAWERYGVL